MGEGKKRKIFVYIKEDSRRENKQMRAEDHALSILIISIIAPSSKWKDNSSTLTSTSARYSTSAYHTFWSNQLTWKHKNNTRRYNFRIEALFGSPLIFAKRVADRGPHAAHLTPSEPKSRIKCARSSRIRNAPKSRKKSVRNERQILLHHLLVAS